MKSGNAPKVLLVTVTGEDEVEGVAEAASGLPPGVKVLRDREAETLARRVLEEAAAVFAVAPPEGESARPRWEESFRALFGSTKEAPRIEVAVTFTDDEGIRAVNRDYRRVDQPTDVLSFPMFSREEAESGELGVLPEEQLLLGDIVISLPAAERQGALYGHSQKRELAYLLVHGFLHLVGHDHEDDSEKQAMRRLEERILGEVGLIRETE